MGIRLQTNVKWATAASCIAVALTLSTRASAAEDMVVFLPEVFVANGSDRQMQPVSGVQVQNLEPDRSIDLIASLSPGRGRSPVRISRPALPPGSAANFFLGAEPVSVQGSYAMEVSATGRVAAIARTDWPSSGASIAYSDPDRGRELIVPLVVKHYNDQVSSVAVQHADPGSPDAANVDVEIYQSGAPGPVLEFNLHMPPGEAEELDFAGDLRFSLLPDGFLGWMRLRSEDFITAMTSVRLVDQPKARYAFEAVPVEQASTSLFVPLFRNAFFGTTGISIVNPGPDPTSVTLTYFPSALAPDCSEPVVHNGAAVTVGGHSNEIFYQGGIVDFPNTGTSNLNSGCFGSATIESSGAPVVAFVNDANLSSITVAAYNASSQRAAAQTVRLPLFRHQHAGLTTGIQVMNVGDEPTEVDLVVWDSNGHEHRGCSVCSAAIDPLGSHTFYPSGPEWSFFPPGSYGSAKLASSGEPIVAIVNDASTDGRVDAAIYNGIPAE